MRMLAYMGEVRWSGVEAADVWQREASDDEWANTAFPLAA